MTGEILRLLSDAMNDTTHGVLAQLAALAASSDIASEDTALIPTEVTVVSGLDDDNLAKGELIRQGKEVLVLIAPDSPLATSPENIKAEYAYGTLSVAFVVAIRSGENPAKKARKGLYVIRAIRLVLQWFFTQRQESRRLRQVTLLRTTTVTEGLIVDDGSSGAIGAVVATVQAHDALAQRLY